MLNHPDQSLPTPPDSTLCASDKHLLKAVRFDRPDHIPMVFHINAACSHHYPQEALAQLMVDYPELFDEIEPPVLPYQPNYLPNARTDHPYTDPWGCVWETTDDGIVGVVTHHPLADWSAFAQYQPPDPAQGDGMGHYLESVASPISSDRLKKAGLRHGHTFLQLCDLRGYENLMFDMIDNEPRLWKLIEMVEQFNAALVQRDLEAGAKWMGYPEDLGMQVGPMLSPDDFRRYIEPVYQRLMAPATEIGCVVHMHCDGDLHLFVDEIIDCGVEILNLQDQVNGIDWIAQNVKGRIAIELDIDRQDVTINGTPAQIDTLIRHEVDKLGSRDGGLTMIYGLYPGTPWENGQAVAEAMVRYAGYYNG